MNSQGNSYQERFPYKNGSSLENCPFRLEPDREQLFREFEKYLKQTKGSD